MAKQTIAGMEYKFTAETASLLSGLEKVRKETTKLRKTVDRESNRIKYAFNKLRRAAQVVASAFIFTAGIRQLGRLVTGIEKAEDRMKLMQARFQQFARAPDAFTRVYNLSQKLGVSMEDTAGSMTRLLIATKSIGTAQADIEKIQENIVILGRAGGTSAEEMKGALIQLSQGIASGRLAGEELRSVMENLPLVAMEIADELGVGIGQLRTMAAEGKVVDKVVVEALKNIGIALEDLPETFGMQTERMATEWDLFLATLGQAVSSAGLLTELIEAVKWVRLNVLGSTLGVPIEDLNDQYKENTLRIIELRKQRQAQAEEDKDAWTAWKQTYGSMNPNRAYDGQTILDQLDDEIDRLIERNEHLAEAIHLQDLADRMARKNAAVQEAVDQGKIDEQLEKGVARFLKTYETAAEEVARKLEELDAWAKLFPDKIPPEIYQRIRAEIENVLYEGIEAIDLQALRNDFKKAPDLVKYYDKVKAKTEEVNKTAQDLGLTFASAFEDAIVRADSLREVLRGLLDDIIRIIARLAVTQPLTDAFTNWFNGIAAGAGAAVAAAAGGGGYVVPGRMPGMASGGPVEANKAYVVGEEGPELLIPRKDAFVVPSANPMALPSMMGQVEPAGSMNVYTTVNVDSRADREQLRAELGPIVAQSVEASVNRVRQLSRRGRLL